MIRSTTAAGEPPGFVADLRSPRRKSGTDPLSLRFSDRLFASSQISRLRRESLRWFDNHQRDLPWRKNRTLYRVWVSEVMLQQTQVATVIPYFRRFVARFPSVGALAAADEATVMRLWEGLGFYRRARQLHQAAKLIHERHRGRCPDTFDEWIELPGIGRYTAGAILSISKDQRLPILEANTIRLHCRLLGLSDDPRIAETQKRLWSFAELLVPRERAGDFNQALMEIGSQVCVPKNPDCSECPLRSGCAAADQGLVHVIPRKAARVEPTHVFQFAVVIQRGDKCLLRKCGPGERWDGLWDVPRFDAAKDQSSRELCRIIRDNTGLSVEVSPRRFTLRHGVTRYKIELSCHVTTRVHGRVGKELNKHWAWVPRGTLAELPLNIAARRIIQRLRLCDGSRDRMTSAGNGM